MTKTKAIFETEPQGDKELVLYIFDGFCTVLLNNLKALYESERAHLAFIFECRAQKDADGNYVQRTFYPELLKMLLWRMKTSDKSQTAADLTNW